jgi:hypothetical protein
MNDLAKIGFLIAGVIGFILYINLLCILIAWWSGWRALAARFRHAFDFRDQIRGWKSARMRAGCHYNNALKVAVNSEGLSLATIAIVPQHPSILIPWNEVRVVRRTTFLSWAFVQLELGTLERIPFTIKESLFTEINRQAKLDASNLW